MQMTSDRTPPTVAIIDDDSGFTTVLIKRFEQAGWHHILLRSAPPVDELASMKLSAIVLNPTMLGQMAWEFMQNVTQALPIVGVVACSSQSTVAQRVRGLRLGLDDWVGKPCHPEEVVARVEAVTRRHRRTTMERIAEEGPLVAGELEFRVDRFEVLAAGKPLELTKREFELLLLLARSDGRVLPRHDIYQRVWGYAMARGDRSVDVFVRKLRQKLELASPEWRYIHTHFGIGYRFGAELATGTEAEAAPVALATAGQIDVPDDLAKLAALADV
jgi:DNA-binding response OmpR family regulator